jgi:hypothetical protein
MVPAFWKNGPVQRDAAEGKIAQSLVSLLFSDIPKFLDAL